MLCVVYIYVLFYMSCSYSAGVYKWISAKPMYAYCYSTDYHCCSQSMAHNIDNIKSCILLIIGQLTLNKCYPVIVINWFTRIYLSKVFMERNIPTKIYVGRHFNAIRNSIISVSAASLSWDVPLNVQHAAALLRDLW